MSPEAEAIRATLERFVAEPGSTPEQQRATWDAATADAPLASGVTERSATVGGVAGRWLEPAGPGAGRVLVWCHGGGLVAGSSLTHRELASRLAARGGFPVFVPDYRRLPEHHLDDAVDDILAVLDGLDGRPTALGGDSSGAALAITTMATAHSRGRALPLAATCLSGAFDATLSSPSVDLGLDPQLDRSVLTPWQAVVGTRLELADPRLSPVLADLRGLPPTLLLAGELDVWRDDSIRLAKRMTDQGSPAKLIIQPAMWHVWPMAGDFPEARSAIGAIADFVNQPR